MPRIDYRLVGVACGGVGGLIGSVVADDVFDATGWAAAAIIGLSASAGAVVGMYLADSWSSARSK